MFSLASLLARERILEVYGPRFLGEEAGFEDERLPQEDLARLRQEQEEEGRARQEVSAGSNLTERVSRYLRALPGPDGDPEPRWDASLERVCLDWLRVPRLCVVALRSFDYLPRVLVRGTDKSGVVAAFRERGLLGGEAQEPQPTRPLVPVPPQERRAYTRNPTALTVRWMIADAERNAGDPRLRSILTDVRAWGASVRCVLMLCFVPALVFESMRVRAAIRWNRQSLERIVRRYSNPQTRLSPDEPMVAELLTLREKGVQPFADTSDEEFKRLIVEACRQLPRDGERALWDAVGLDKTMATAPSRQVFWDWVALPILRYLEPFVPVQKAEAEPRVTPDLLFTVVSRLLSVRSGGLWEDVSGRLKGRWYEAM